MRSVYAGQPGIVFGKFSAADGNRRLGYACEQEVERCDDDDPRVYDIFGVPMRRGAHAQHTSGRNRYGEFVSGGLVREIGINREVWSDRDDTQPSVIVREISSREALHASEWSDAAYYFTLDGLRRQFDHDQAFDVDDVLRKADDCRQLRDAKLYKHLELSGCDIHRRAVRRWLDSVVGVSNVHGGAALSKRYPTTCGAPIVRRGRWRWSFHEPA